jgi:hypothetical protein
MSYEMQRFSYKHQNFSEVQTNLKVLVVLKFVVIIPVIQYIFPYTKKYLYH